MHTKIQFFSTYSFQCIKFSFLYAFLLFVLAYAQIGCSGTISPNLPISNQTSPGYNGLHSDIKAVIYGPDGKTIIAQIVYTAWRDRYNLLADIYGNTLIPPIRPDDHLTPDGAYWRADQTAILSMVWMEMMRRRSQK